MFAKLRDRYRRNFALLREAADLIGRDYEAMSYDELAGGPADQSEGEMVHEGVDLTYSAYSFVEKKNGDIGFCIDIYSKLPTFLGGKPSYLFYKRPNGEVYY